MHPVAVPAGCRLQNCGHSKKIIRNSFPKAAEQPKRHISPDRQRAHVDFRETAAY
jgi:hypothetical protein